MITDKYAPIGQSVYREIMERAGMLMWPGDRGMLQSLHQALWMEVDRLTRENAELRARATLAEGNPLNEIN